jgi:hypothetical protein
MSRTFASALLIAVLSFGIILGFGPNSIASASTTVSGRIESDATWTKAGSPYILTGNVLVSKGVTLTIEAGVTVNLNDYLMMVNGTLIGKGTSSDKIQFSGGTLKITETSSSWNEATGSGCIIENANFDTLVSIYGSPKIGGCYFNSVGIGGNTVFSNNVVNQSGIYGSPTITGNTSSVSSWGSDAWTPLISYNTLSDGLYIGYLAGLPTISHNTIEGGIKVENTKSVLIDSNDITGDLSISSGNGTIANNNIKGSISTCSDDLRISNNVISDTDVGINLTPESPAGFVNVTITGNKIAARQTGLMVPPTFSAFIYGWYCKAVVSGNTITGCAGSAINVGGGEAQSGYSPAANNVTIINNRFFDNHYAINTAGIGRIEGNVIVHNYWGISGGGPVKNNIVADNTYGISCGVIEGNFVANNKYGIMGYVVNNINCNTIINNEVGVSSGFSDMHYNNIYGNSINVNYTIPNDGNATYNWWGTTDANTIGQSIRDYEEDFLLGKVNFDPTLTGLSASAPSPDTQIPTFDSTVPTITVQPTPTPSVPEYSPQTLLIMAALMVTMLAVVVVTRKKAK